MHFNAFQFSASAATRKAGRTEMFSLFALHPLTHGATDCVHLPQDRKVYFEFVRSSPEFPGGLAEKCSAAKLSERQISEAIQFRLN